MKKRVVLFSIIFLLNVFLVSASDKINVTIIEQDNQVDLNEYASFKLQILNNDFRNHDFFITSAYSKDFRIVVEPYLVNIPAKYYGEIKVDVYPLSMLGIGSYDVLLDIKSRDNEIELKYPLNFKIVPKYGNFIDIKLIMPKSIDPRNGMTLKLALENLYKYELKDLKIELKSGIFNKKDYIDLKPREKAIKEFNIVFDKELKPGTYNLDVEISKNDQVYGRISKKLDVNEYFEINEKISREEGFLINKITLAKENTGTNVSNEELSYTVNGLQKIFSSYNINPDKIIKAENGYKLEWSFALQPDESKEIIIKTNYTVLFFSIIAILIIGFLIYYYGGKRIFVYKLVKKVGKSGEGINHAEVVLKLRNKTGHYVKNIKLVDYIPRLITINRKDFDGVKPNKLELSKSSGIMRVIWDIKGLDDNEEKVLSYEINSRMSIVGRLILPSAVVEYKTKKGFTKVSSNRLTILTS